MYSYLEIKNDTFNEIWVKFCGIQKCSANYAYGPAIRSHYLIHYCLKGKGYYHIHDKIYPVEAGQAFLIFPNDTTFYRADEKDPWTYLWIGFDGDKAEYYCQQCGFSSVNHVITCQLNKEIQTCVESMIAHHQMSYSNELFIQGQLYLFFSYLSQNHPYYPKKDNVKSNNIYITKAILFIQNNYQNKISVQDLADYLSLNRSYLSSLFKKHLKTTPQNFLLQYRMNKARDLLVDTDLPINQIAYSCGYANQLAFSKAFHHTHCSSPSQYRKSNQLKEGQILIK